MFHYETQGEFMKKSIWTLFVVLIFSTKLLFQQAIGAVEYIPGEVIVKFKSGHSKSFLANKSAEFYDSRLMQLSAGEFGVLKVKNKSSIESIIRVLSDEPAIEYAEPNYLYRAINQRLDISDILAGTSDPKYSKLWGLKNTGRNEPQSSGGNSSSTGIADADINAERAWSLSKGDKNIVIAVIDTGVDYEHEDLSNNIWVNQVELNGAPGVDDDGNGYIDDIHGYDFANKDGDPMDGNGHGTHVAGTIAAEHNNGVGIAGVMAQASIMGIKFLSDQGSGSSADAIAAIDYATKMNVDIMSNSWGGGGFSQALEDAIAAASAKGIIFTAAAGNSSTDNNNIPHYPSNYDIDNVISVAAHNYSDELASFSCYGSNTVHVAAPGRNILSTTPKNTYDVYSGTSMATPHVTGVVGLYLAYNGKTDPARLRKELMDSSIYARSYGRRLISGGRVDAYNFLNGIAQARPAKPDPNAWGVMQVDILETPHPYPNKYKLTKTYQVPGAKFLRVIFKKFDVENNYDAISILDSDGVEVQRVDGSGADFKSEYVDGDKITIEFNADPSVNKWGFVVEEIEYIQ